MDEPNATGPNAQFSVSIDLGHFHCADIVQDSLHLNLTRHTDWARLILEAVMLRIFFLLISLLLPALAAAQDDPRFLELGGDIYGGGSTLVLADTAAHDVFLAAQDTSLAVPITGSAHMAGQTVTIAQTVAGNAYAAGQTVTLSGAVTGNATLAGQTVATGDIGGNLRAFGQSVAVNGSVGGAALIAAQSVGFNGAIAGDVAVNASKIDFGPAARIAGKLTIYHSDPASITVPDGVMPAERISRKTVEEWSEDAPTSIGMTRGAIWRGLVSTIVVVTVLAAILAALIPAKLSQMRSTFLARPFRSFWFGFLTLSAAIGAAVVLAMSLIGLLAMPLSIVLAILLGFTGYIVGAYALGVGLLGLIGREVPGAWIERALAAAVGAIVIAAVGLVPFAGWLVVLAVTLTGLGAVCIVLFRPEFYSEAKAAS
jgi:cytoskeletal protein CcmA (bactofilin family)